MFISIVFSTFGHEHILEKTLEAYSRIQTAREWQLIVIDNAGRGETRLLVEKYSTKLPILLLTHTKPGKNSALNHALEFIEGNLVFFTDNDILPPPEIIDLLAEAGNQNPTYSVFTGRISPDIELPGFLDQGNPKIRAALGILYKGNQDREIYTEEVWGGCMLLRRSILEQGYQFNTSIGPMGNDYIVGGETEFLLQLDCRGYKALYLAKLHVYHQIRHEQLEIKWLRKRAWRAGRGRIANSKKKENEGTRLAGVPRYLLRQQLQYIILLLVSFLSFSKKNVANASMDCWYNLGKIRQFKNQARYSRSNNQ